MSDIKATVEELERSHAADEDTLFCTLAMNAWPSLLAELRRLLAIEEAAVRYRDKFDGSCKGYCSVMDELSTRDALFAALPPRKESTP